MPSLLPKPFVAYVVIWPYRNAILNAGYSASATHALAGGIKTDAPRSILHDIIRAYIADGHAVKMENIKEGSPARVLLAKEASLVLAYIKSFCLFCKRWSRQVEG